MKLNIVIGGRAREVECRADGESWIFRLDGAPERRALVARPEPGVYSILLDGRSYEARVEASPGALVIHVGGSRFEVEMRDPRKWEPASRFGAHGGRQNLAAPMPGKVVRVLVREGDTVEAAQGVVVVEAMKMQNEIKAGRPGQVIAIHAREGAPVSAGEVLAVIE